MIHNETMLKDASKIMTSMLSTGQWEACRKPFEAAIKFIEMSVNYQGYYTHLYEGKAICIFYKKIRRNM